MNKIGSISLAILGGMAIFKGDYFLSILVILTSVLFLYGYFDEVEDINEE